MLNQPRAVRRGFTLIELLVTLTLLSLLMTLALPSFSVWVANARVRTVSQALQDGMRLAQAEAVRRNRVVVFALTNGEPGPSSKPSAVANGMNWMVYTVPLLGFESREYVQGGSLSDVAGGVTITGQAAVCFNTAGRRQTSNAAPGVTGADCTTGAALQRLDYTVRAGSSDRPLRVTVSLGGQVRTCDPARVLSASAPDGCPA